MLDSAFEASLRKEKRGVYSQKVSCISFDRRKSFVLGIDYSKGGDFPQSSHHESNAEGYL